MALLFLALLFLALLFLAVVFCVLDFFAVELVAGVLCLVGVIFFAGLLVLPSVFAAALFVPDEEDLRASARPADDLLAVELVDFVVGVVFFAGELCFAGVLFVAVPLDLPSVFAAAFFVPVEDDLLASALAADFLPAADPDVLAVVVFFAADVFFAALDLPAPDVPEVVLPADEAATLGSFLAPATTSFSSDPARNLGTAVFLARLRSPVRGLRTIRDGRTAFSKAPKPVIATFSPFATSRVIVSTTDSRACRADFLLPSKRLDNASMNWLLFKGLPFREL